MNYLKVIKLNIVSQNDPANFDEITVRELIDAIEARFVIIAEGFPEGEPYLLLKRKMPIEVEYPKDKYETDAEGNLKKK